MRTKSQKKKTIDPAAISNKEVFEMMCRKDPAFREDVAKEIEKIRRREQRKKQKQSPSSPTF